MNQLPRWYIEQGKPRSAHICAPGGMTLMDGVGPDAVGGGTIIGGDYVPGETGWLNTGAGWWIHLHEVAPQTLAKLSLHPRILRWSPVAGSVNGHWWQVPVLLAPLVDGSGNAVLYQSALDRSWNGKEWIDPADLTELQTRLHQVAFGLANGTVASDAELVRVVTDLLSLGHHLHAAEMAAAGWLTHTLLLRILLAAADVPLCEAADG